MLCFIKNWLITSKQFLDKATYFPSDGKYIFYHSPKLIGKDSKIHSDGHSVLISTFVHFELKLGDIWQENLNIRIC